jgi:hypothetical protein
MPGVSRTTASLLVGLAVVSAVGVWLWTSRSTGDDTGSCPLTVTEREPAAQFVERESLLPSGTVGERRQVVVEALEGLGPVGTVEAGRFFESQAGVPALVAYGERLTLVAAPEGRPARVTVVDPAEPGAPTDWSSDVAPGEDWWTTFTGGAVGPDWVSVFSGKAPALLSLDGEGAQNVCLPVPLSGAGTDVTAVTAQAGEEVVVLASAATGGAWFGVVDPSSGEVVSERRDQGAATWQKVEVAGDLVVGSRWLPSTIGTSGAPRPGDAQAPWVAAWGLDGAQRWTYPAEDARTFPAVLLDLAEDGTSYVGSFDRGGPWLDAVTPTGERAWRQPIQPGEWSGSLWDDVVVVRGPDPGGGPMLRAYDARDGSERFVVRARQAPRIGDDPRSGFGEPLTDEQAWWVPGPNGLLRIDRRTDAVRRVDSEARVDQLLRVGERVVVRSGPAVLVTR